MVGNGRARRRVMAVLTDPTRHAYVGAARRWAADAMLVYGPLAKHLVDRSPIAMGDCTALDAGAGTGAIGAVLVAAGARVISCDLEDSMLRNDSRTSAVGAAAVADVMALPFRNGGVDATVAGFVLNHLADPVAGLRELRRVTRSSGVVLASVFGENRAPAKEAIDAVLSAHGWQPPPWYSEMQARASALATTDQMARAGRCAELVSVEVDRADVDVGLDSAALVVRYRFGMPQVSNFLDTLGQSELAALFAEATAAVESTGKSFRPNVVELVARVR